MSDEDSADDDAYLDDKSDDRLVVSESEMKAWQLANLDDEASDEDDEYPRPPKSRVAVSRSMNF